MDPSILLDIGLLLLFAKIFGIFTERLGISSLVGEVLAGVILIASGVIKISLITDEILGIGILFILFQAGLSIKFEDIEKEVYTGTVLAAGGALLSFAFGFLASYLILNNIIISLVIGIVLVSTDDGTTLRLITMTGDYKTRTGKTIIATSIADDIIGILCLSLLTMYMTVGNIAANDLMRLFLISIGFYFFILTVGYKMMNKILNSAANVFLHEHIFISLPIVILFLIGVFSDKLGLGAAAGAFLAGIIMSKSSFTESVIKPKISVIGSGFFIPLFFAFIGTKIVFGEANILLIIFLVVAAILGKFIGSGLLGSLYKFRSPETYKIGLSLMPRGDYAIVISQIAIMGGIITAGIYTSLISVIILTIILAPIILKIVRNRHIEYS